MKNINKWEHLRYFEKAVRFYKNAVEELKQIPIENGFYKDEKVVRKVAGLCYNSVLEAAKGFLLKKNIEIEKKLKSFDAYRWLLAQGDRW